MGELKKSEKVHVVLLPFPIVGRTNPMLQFAKRLSSKGLLVTLATTSAFASNLLLPKVPFLTIATLSDALGAPSDTVSIDDYAERFERIASLGLAELIKNQSTPVRCIIYDSSQIWALPLARQLGIFAAPFFPQSCAVSLIFRHVFKGVLASPNDNDHHRDDVLAAPGLPPLSVTDLPSFVQQVGRFPMLEKVVLMQFHNFDDADWQFFNSFDVLEHEVLNWMRIQWPTVKSIGPTIPSMYLDMSLEDDKEYGLSVFRAEVDACIQWLDTKADSSTLYVSFGSIADLGDAQMEELASALTNSGKPFLWVVRSSEESKLPKYFKEELMSPPCSLGLIVSWCPQLEVLAHRAVGCFFTHCGWNSTLEAISSGVPMVAMPQWADQPTNAMFVEKVWRVGVRVKQAAHAVVKREEIEGCIREVMEGPKGEEMRSNAYKLKIQAKAAMEEGGTSDMNIDDFVAKLFPA